MTDEEDGEDVRPDVEPLRACSGMQQEPGRRSGKWFADPSEPDETSLVFTNADGSAFASAATTHTAAKS